MFLCLQLQVRFKVLRLNLREKRAEPRIVVTTLAVVMLRAREASRAAYSSDDPCGSHASCGRHASRNNMKCTLQLLLGSRFPRFWLHAGVFLKRYKWRRIGILS